MITADGRTDGTISSGSAIALTLEDELFIERGHVGATPHHAPITAREFKGRVFWLHDDPLRIGDTVPLRIGTQHVHVRLVQINGVLDVQTLERNETPVNVVHRHEVAEVKLRAHRPLVFDPVSRLAATGRFVLLRGNRIGGGGVIDDVIHEDNPGQNLPVGPKARARLLGHRGGVIWLTGLSGSGKTTLAVAAEQELFRAGVLTVVLDGDVLRAGLCAGLGFDEADRKENIRRTAEAALLMAEAGAIVITALISPYRADRALGAERCRTREVPFAEVYVNAPLEECERRDPKHLYQRVRKGKIPAFTGISSPYEEPQQPALEVRTDLETVEESVGKLVQLALALASKS